MKTHVLILLSLLAFGCAHNPITIYPKPPAATVASYWSHKNIIDADSNGEIVTAEWVRVYQELLKTYADKIPVRNRPANPTQGISDSGNVRFHVDWTVVNRFILLKSFDQP